MIKLLNDLRNKKLTISERGRLKSNSNKSIPGMEDLITFKQSLATNLRDLWNKYIISDELRSLLEKHPPILYKRGPGEAEFYISGHNLGIFDLRYPNSEDPYRIDTEIRVSIPKDDTEVIIVPKDYLWGPIRFNEETLSKIPDRELESIKDLVSNCIEKKYEIERWRGENLTGCSTFGHVYKVSPQIYLDLVKYSYSEAMFQEAAGGEDLKKEESPVVAPTRSESRRSNEELNQEILESLKTTLDI